MCLFSLNCIFNSALEHNFVENADKEAVLNFNMNIASPPPLKDDSSSMQFTHRSSIK